MKISASERIENYGKACMKQRADTFAARLATDLDVGWRDTVELCSVANSLANFDELLKSIAASSGKSYESLRRKCDSVLGLLREHGKEEVKAMGEAKALSFVQQQRKQKHPEKESFALRLPESSKAALLERLDRIGTLIGSRSRETQADLLVSILDGLDDETIKQHAQVGG